MCLESSMKKSRRRDSTRQIQEFSPRSQAAAIALQPASMQGGEPTTRKVQQVVGEREEVSNRGSRALAGDSPESGRLTPSALARHLANRKKLETNFSRLS